MDSLATRVGAYIETEHVIKGHLAKVIGVKSLKIPVSGARFPSPPPEEMLLSMQLLIGAFFVLKAPRSLLNAFP